MFMIYRQRSYLIILLLFSFRSVLTIFGILLSLYRECSNFELGNLFGPNRSQYDLLRDCQIVHA